MRDPSFPPLLVQHLGDEAVVDDCIYACPAILALTLHAWFAGWTPPANLDAKLDTVQDLRREVARAGKINLAPRRLGELVSGPGFERWRKEVEGKSEDELIRLAGGRNPPRDYAAMALQASVATSKNLNELYLLAMNEPRPDGGAEFRAAIYEAIYRAETASARARSRSPR